MALNGHKDNAKTISLTKGVGVNHLHYQLWQEKATKSIECEEICINCWCYQSKTFYKCSLPKIADNLQNVVISMMHKCDNQSKYCRVQILANSLLQRTSKFENV